MIDFVLKRSIQISTLTLNTYNNNLINTANKIIRTNDIQVCSNGVQFDNKYK